MKIPARHVIGLVFFFYVHYQLLPVTTHSNGHKLGNVADEYIPVPLDQKQRYRLKVLLDKKCYPMFL